MASLNLVQLVQTLQDQQDQHTQATAAISKTLQEQQRHQQKMAAEIADTLKQISGMLSSLLGGVQRPAAPAKPQSVTKVTGKTGGTKAAVRSGMGTKRQTGKFSTTAAESILAFVRKHGNPLSSELASHWKSEGRGGKADKALGRLVTDKKLKRAANVGGRGSRYSIP